MSASAVIYDREGKKRENMVSKRKVMDAIDNAGEAVRNKLAGQEITGFAWDGKQEKVPQMDSRGKPTASKVRDNISVCRHETDQKLGFYVNEDATGAGVAAETVEYLEQVLKIKLGNLELIICDGCNTNTGYKDGAAYHIQRMQKRSLFVAVCLLHHIELPMRKLFTDHEGKSGREVFDGELGKQLQKDVWDLPIGDFEPVFIPGYQKLDKDVLKDLSKDMKDIHELCGGLKEGKDHVPEKLAARKLGPMCSARWITFQSRVIRYYMSCQCPEKHRAFLKQLVLYIARIYLLAHFNIKKKRDVVYGPEHTWQELQRVRALYKDNPHYLAMMDKVVINNAYFSHPYAFVVGLLGSEDAEVRRKGLKIEKQARRMDHETRDFLGPQYQFILPEMNFEATHWSEMLVLKEGGEFRHDTFIPSSKYGRLVRKREVRVRSNPLLRKYSDAQIDHFEYIPLRTPYSCHNQACERAVAATTRVCSRLKRYDRQLDRHLMAEEGMDEFPGSEPNRKRIFGAKKPKTND